MFASFYTVLVRNLPPDASAMELERHFSSLYQLADPDWAFTGHCGGLCCRKRPRMPQDVIDSGDVPRADVTSVGGAMEPLRPVGDVSNTGNEGFAGCVGRALLLLLLLLLRARLRRCSSCCVWRVCVEGPHQTHEP